MAECKWGVITCPNTSKFEMITFKITNFLFNLIPPRKLFIEVVKFRLFQALADIGLEHIARTSLFLDENAKHLKWEMLIHNRLFIKNILTWKSFLKFLNSSWFGTKYITNTNKRSPLGQKDQLWPNTACVVPKFKHDMFKGFCDWKVSVKWRTRL